MDEDKIGDIIKDLKSGKTPKRVNRSILSKKRLGRKNGFDSMDVAPTCYKAHK